VSRYEITTFETGRISDEDVSSTIVCGRRSNESTQVMRPRSTLSARDIPSRSCRRGKKKLNANASALKSSRLICHPPAANRSSQ
jgi:hypothetical protein